MRPWSVILLVSILAILAISSGWKVLYVLTYVLGSLFLLSWWWTSYSLRKLNFSRSSPGGRIQVGEVFDERLTLDNLSVMPKLWVQIVDGSTLPEHRAGYVATMKGRKRAIWRARTTCRQRGHFRLGPVTATSGDPFGLFRKRIVLSHEETMLVLPRVLPLSIFPLFSGGLPGKGRSARKALQTTTNATGVREYVVGDGLNRIHWKSSAHYNRLMVKEFDLDPAVDAWLILDLQEKVQAGTGEESTEEYAVTITASIAAYLLRQDYSVGLIVNGSRREMLSIDRGDRQLERVLELLAVAEAGEGPDLQEALAFDALHFGRNTVALVVTPSSSQAWHDGVKQLLRRGVQVGVIGLDAASFAQSAPQQDNLLLLEGSGIPVLRVKAGEPLQEVLEKGTQIQSLSRR